MVNTEIRLIIFFAAKDGEALYSQQKQDQELTVAHELLIAKFRLKLKKVGKTTRPFRYKLNQTPYDYTVEVRNRFKGLDLIECLKNYGWRFMTLYTTIFTAALFTVANIWEQPKCLSTDERIKKMWYIYIHVQSYIS